MDRALRVSSRLIALVTLLLGLTMIVVTLVRGGGPLAVGVVGGLLLVLVGAVRWRA